MRTPLKAAAIVLAAAGIAGSTAATASAETITLTSDTNRAGCWAKTTYVWGESRGMVNMTVTSNCGDALVSVSQPLFDPPCQELNGGYAKFYGAGKWPSGALPEPYVC